MGGAHKLYTRRRITFRSCVTFYRKYERIMTLASLVNLNKYITSVRCYYYTYDARVPVQFACLFLRVRVRIHE
jgi:hypothetical protein